MMNLLFTLCFVLVAPFWALFILAPTWRWTRRIAASPWIVAGPVLIYLIVVLPRLGEVLPAVAGPTLDGVLALLATPAGATIGWAHFIAFDLFVGRWIYLDSRERELHPVLMAPILALTILLGPVGYALYLGVRAVAKASVSGRAEHP